MTGENIDLSVLISPRERQRHARIAALSRLIKISPRHEDSFPHCEEYSDDGMRLTSEVPLELDHRTYVVFAPPVAIGGRAMWGNDIECGIAFEEEVDSAVLMSAAVALRPTKTGGRGRLATAIKRNSDHLAGTSQFGAPGPEWM